MRAMKNPPFKTPEAQQLRDHASEDTTTEPGFVWVYQYSYWDHASEARLVSTRFATAEVIRCGLGEAIPHTGKKIPITDLIEGAFAE